MHADPGEIPNGLRLEVQDPEPGNLARHGPGQRPSLRGERHRCRRVRGERVPRLAPLHVPAADLDHLLVFLGIHHGDQDLPVKGKGEARHAAGAAREEAPLQARVDFEQRQTAPARSDRQRLRVRRERQARDDVLVGRERLPPISGGGRPKGDLVDGRIGRSRAGRREQRAVRRESHRVHLLGVGLEDDARIRPGRG